MIAARYIKQSNYDAAANILSEGAKALLQAGAQQGASASGGDLAIMLVLEVYNKAGWEVADDEIGKKRKRTAIKISFRRRTLSWNNTDFSLERLIELLREFPPEEPTRKRYINEIISWSSKFGGLERGDPDLHHAIGSAYAQGMFITS